MEQLTETNGQIILDEEVHQIAPSSDFIVPLKRDKFQRQTNTETKSKDNPADIDKCTDHTE